MVPVQQTLPTEQTFHVRFLPVPLQISCLFQFSVKKNFEKFSTALMMTDSDN